VWGLFIGVVSMAISLIVKRCKIIHIFQGKSLVNP